MNGGREGDAGPGGRLVRRALDWDLEPWQVLRLVRTDPHPVALLGSWAGGSDIVGSAPTRVRSPPAPLEDVTDGSWPGRSTPGDAARRHQGPQSFGGGWIGYLGFALAEQLLPAPGAPGDARRLPAWWFGHYDHVLRRDRTTGAWAFEAWWTPDRDRALEVRFDELSRRAGLAPAQPRAYTCGEFAMTPSAAGHRAAVRATVDDIGRGDIFQANICLRLEAPFTGDPLDVFCRAAERLQPPYAAYVGLDEGAVASLSPELFLRRSGSTVSTRPIKGTAARSADPAEAARQRDLLLHSAKDRAENVMIVDLMRNDLSRVCTPGSVVTPTLMQAQAHPGVWHLVSHVQGQVRPGTGDGDLIAATFPPGSVTGAPKVRAVEIIHAVEPTPREVYTGAIGYRSPLAGLELNVAIRTFEFHGDRVWLGSGGGITARSSDEDEYRECLLKAGPLIDAIGGVLDGGVLDGAILDGAILDGGVASGEAGSSAPATRTPVPQAMRPRPAAGVFTSLRVTDGRAHDLEAHLARLDASTWQLYGKHLPPTLDDLLRGAVRRHPSGRLRITAQPVGGPLQVTAEVVAAGPAPAALTLRPATIPGGLGARKWLDRRLLADLTATHDTDEQLLVLDLDGTVLETDRGNVFAVAGDALCTPVADHRLLPGVTRAAVLQLATAAGIPTREATLTVADLAGASEVFVTGSVHGVRPVRALAGAASSSSWEPGPVTARIAALLAGSARAAVTTTVVAPAPVATVDPPPRRGGGRGRPVVVLVDNHDSFTYNLAHLLATQGCQVEVVLNDEVTADAVGDFAPDGIVISPGPCTPAEAGISVDVVRRCGPRTPLLGVCLGHQSIAVAFDSPVVRAPEPVHGSSSAIVHDGRGLLAGLPQHFTAARYHSLVVQRHALAPGLTVTASTTDGVVMGVRHRRYPVEGVQFHPESVLTTHGDRLIATFRRSLGAVPTAERRRSPGDLRVVTT